MQSKLAAAVKLRTYPVAVLFSDDRPDDALQFETGARGCVVSMIVAASHGRTAVFDKDTCGCGGGAVGLGFGTYGPGIYDFLSTGAPGREGERYKKTPEYARASIDSMPPMDVPTRYVVLKPLPTVGEDETPEAIIFLVNPDQLSGLVTLANFDRPTKDNVVVLFGAGCHSTIREPVAQGREKLPRAVVGLTDPSARPHLDANLLSFSVPYNRFCELEEEAAESFLQTPTWAKIAARI